jgi:hypothetical protein
MKTKEARRRDMLRGGVECTPLIPTKRQKLTINIPLLPTNFTLRRLGSPPTRPPRNLFKKLNRYRRLQLSVSPVLGIVRGWDRVNVPEKGCGLGVYQKL